MLTQEEKGLLRELQADPRWRAILDKMTRDHPTPYHPDKNTNHERWMYESGRYRENDSILSTLSLRED